MPNGIEIQTINFEPVEQKLNGVEDEMTRLAASTLTRDGAELLVNTAATYPAERPGQKYVRSYDYQKSVTGRTAVMGKTVDYKVSDAQPPTHWIHGEVDGSYGGAWMHIGRWKSWKKIAEVELQQLVQRVVTRISYFIKFRFG